LQHLWVVISVSCNTYIQYVCHSTTRFPIWHLVSSTVFKQPCLKSVIPVSLFSCVIHEYRLVQTHLLHFLSDFGKISYKPYAGNENFYICTVHHDTIKVYYSPTSAQVICLKKIIKIYIKMAPTCFCAVTPSSGSSLFMLAKVKLYL
jgi:hypothetical protein